MSFGVSIWAYVSIILALVAFYFWLRRKRYTRERFAISGFAALVTLTSLLIFAASTNVRPSDFIVAALLKPLGSVLTPSPLTTPIAVILGTLVIALIIGYVQVFKSWSGKKSIAHYEQEDTNQQLLSAIFEAFVLIYKDDERLKTYQAETQKESFQYHQESVAWHSRAVALCGIVYDAIRFDNKPEDYIKQYQLYWGKYKSSARIAAVFCSHQCPDIAKLKEVTDFIIKEKDISAQQEVELIIAVKQGELSDEIKMYKVQGIVLKFTTEDELLTDLVNFEDYFEDIRHIVEDKKLMESDYTLKDTYTPSLYSKTQDGKVGSEAVEQFIDNWLLQDSSKQMALLGEYGQGKTTVSQMMSYKLIERYKQNKTTRIPIIIELRGYAVRTHGAQDFLSLFAGKYNLQAQSLYQLHLAGRLLLIFEGFDEIDLRGDVEDRIKHFEALWKSNFDNSKIIITGRPNFFFEQQKLKNALGDEHDNHLLYLAPFNHQQIAHSLRNIDQGVATEILDFAKKDAHFNEVAARPSLLFAVHMLWRKEKLNQLEQLNSAVVIDLFIIDTLRRQQAKQKDKKFMVLNTPERRYLMSVVAAYMAIHNLQNQISSGDLRKLIDSVADKIPEVVSKNSSTACNEDIRPIQQRLDWRDRTKVLDSIFTDVHSCGLLVTDASKDKHFKFAHKSYMELLQGATVADSLLTDNETEKLTSQSIVNNLNYKVDHIKSSEEATNFMVQKLGSRVKHNNEKSQKLVRDVLLDVFVLCDIKFGFFKKYIMWFWFPVLFKVIGGIPKVRIEFLNSIIVATFLILFVPLTIMVLFVVNGLHDLGLLIFLGSEMSFIIFMSINFMVLYEYILTQRFFSFFVMKRSKYSRLINLFRRYLSILIILFVVSVVIELGFRNVGSKSYLIFAFLALYLLINRARFALSGFDSKFTSRFNQWLQVCEQSNVLQLVICQMTGSQFKDNLAIATRNAAELQFEEDQDRKTKS